LQNEHFRREKVDEAAVIPKKQSWGIWTYKEVMKAYKTLAAEMRVEIGALVTHVLMEWLRENRETLTDEDKLLQFGNYLARKYGPNVRQRQHRVFSW
jgi:hypothetical protein